MTGRVHADIDALREFHGALARFRHAQRDLADRGDERAAAARASLEARAGQWRSRLEAERAELDACRMQAAAAAGGDGPGVDCSGYARAVTETEERLERIRLWQYRVDEEASEFRGAADRFRDLLETGLPRTEDHLRALITSLEAVRRVQDPGA